MQNIISNPLIKTYFIDTLKKSEGICVVMALAITCLTSFSHCIAKKIPHTFTTTFNRPIVQAVMSAAIGTLINKKLGNVIQADRTAVLCFSFGLIASNILAFVNKSTVTKSPLALINSKIEKKKLKLEKHISDDQSKINACLKEAADYIGTLSINGLSVNWRNTNSSIHEILIKCIRLFNNNLDDYKQTLLKLQEFNKKINELLPSSYIVNNCINLDGDTDYLLATLTKTYIGSNDVEVCEAKAKAERSIQDHFDINLYNILCGNDQEYLAEIQKVEEIKKRENELNDNERDTLLYLKGCINIRDMRDMSKVLFFKAL